MLQNQISQLEITVEGVTLQGDLTLAEDPLGLVVFAHGSGSSRKSPRNRFVADFLVKHHLSTLLFDLLTLEEERIDAIDAHLRFDIPMLADRLTGVTDWLKNYEPTRDLPIGYFGASTGAAAALIAAARRPEACAAVVSRGGRADLAGPALAEVRAPTLLIVGGADTTVLSLNQQALAQISAPCELAVVPGATHLFEEEGALEQVEARAANWFTKHLGT